MLFKSKIKWMHLSISKFATFLIFLKLEKNLFLSTLIADITGNSILVKHEHLAFLVSLLYSVNSQFSSHTEIPFFLNSSCLSFKVLSVPLSLVNE